MLVGADDPVRPQKNLVFTKIYGEIVLPKGGQRRPPLQKFRYLSRVYLKTPNAPGQRVFLRCAASFFLEIRQYSCEKMSCAT